MACVVTGSADREVKIAELVANGLSCTKFGNLRGHSKQVDDLIASSSSLVDAAKNGEPLETATLTVLCLA